MKLALIERSMHKVYEAIYEVLKKDFDVDIISSDIKADTVLEEYGNKSSTPFVYYKGLFKHLRKTKPDVVMVRSYYRLYSLTAILYSILYRKKLIISEEQNQHCKNWIKNFVFQVGLIPLKIVINAKVHKMICVTEKSYEFMKEHDFAGGCDAIT